VAPDDAAADAFVAEVAARLADPARARPHAPRGTDSPPGATASPPWDKGPQPGRTEPLPVVVRPAWDSYLEEFAQIQDELHAGNTYEALLAHTVRVTAPVEPLSLYLRLRALNPAPYAAYLRHGDVKVLSTSPERFLSAGPDDVLEARPIKGTTPRGETVQEDALHRWRLGHEPKFLAENLMIADLLRNDLSRVCTPGSVQVSELMAVESYASVHQLVTTVQGRRRPETGVVDCIRALFPGGSMTGAPKLRTMEIIDRVEDGPRGIFAGALGWVGQDGGCDLSIVIRTLVGTGADEDGAWTIGVGGGIVVSSRAEEEYDETEWKASRLLAALTEECAARGGAVQDGTVQEEAVRRGPRG
jgi:para-aminobenzoate synthetase